MLLQISTLRPQICLIGAHTFVLLNQCYGTAIGPGCCGNSGQLASTLLAALLLVSAISALTPYLILVGYHIIFVLVQSTLYSY